MRYKSILFLLSTLGFVGLEKCFSQSPHEAYMNSSNEGIAVGQTSDSCESIACDVYSASCREFTFCGWLNGEETAYRKRLAENGITFSNNLTNFYSGNTRGGLERDFRFAGHGDYLANIDINKLGGPEGQLLQIRTEHRFGEPLGEVTGALLPSYLATDLPVPDINNLIITNVLFTQALSESFAIYAGKLDTLGGDENAFAQGRGIHQFSNSAFVVNPIGLRTIAYATLGTGFVILDEGETIFNFLVLNARDTIQTDGFSELFSEGVVLAPELRLPTNFFGLPGHQLFGAVWSSRDYVALDQTPFVILPNVPIARKADSWAFTYNFDQYLVVDSCDSKKGWGLFGRAGIADPDTNPINYFLSLGIGGNSRLRGNVNDTFGIGWYYSGTSNEVSPFLSQVLGNMTDGQGGEMYYNFAVNKRLFITADSQVILPARSSVDTSLLFGIRANLTF